MCVRGIVVIPLKVILNVYFHLLTSFSPLFLESCPVTTVTVVVYYVMVVQML